MFPDLSDADEAAYRTAAIRELQEEANVDITIDDLQPFAHWVTPEIEIRRFDTRFFLARMPAGQVAKHDEGETTALEWLSPREAIARFERRELLLPPPTWTTHQAAGAADVDRGCLRVGARRGRSCACMPGFFKNGDEVMLTLPGDPLFPTIPGWEVPEETRFVLEEGARWQPLQGLTAPSISVIELLQRRSDGPARRVLRSHTQFVMNGAPFETLLGRPPTDPLVLMLARGPAGYRFTAKALQHAIPDAKTRRGEIDQAEPLYVDLKLWLSGTLRGSGEPLNTVVGYDPSSDAAGPIEVAEAGVDPAALEKIRQARLQP